MYFGFALVIFVAGMVVAGPFGSGAGVAFFGVAAIFLVAGVVKLRRRAPLPTSSRHRGRRGSGWGAAGAGGAAFFGSGDSGSDGGGSSCGGGGGSSCGGGGGGCGGG
ncbi:hypothetical protein [Nocardia sp. NPDC050793]|uniref:hypothetical protein n=1 Tax=Nocardia sp. NPDC050793 TaxID=3155159 RepID=UPI00340A16AE